MLDNLKYLVESLASFDAKEELKQIVSSNAEKIADLQQDQWMEGRGVDGEFIRPFYSEDPYFKSPESAARYAKWKQKITPNPQRPEDVPNLYITGYFHESLTAKIIDESFDIDSDVSFADKVFKTHENAKGLNEEKRLLFAENITLPEFGKVLKEKTGLEL